MSAIVAAMVARSRRINLIRQVSLVIDEAPRRRMLRAADYHEQRLADAGRAIVDASNRACRAMVVEGAPRTWAVRWLYSAWRGWFAVADRSCVGACVGFAPDRDQRLRPTWDAANRLWSWGTAAHDPRPCAWPRPFARGA